jgi:CBS-domain-containing membrane protein
LGYSSAPWASTPRWEFVILIGVAATILVAVGLVGNKINRAEYPHYWW